MAGIPQLDKLKSILLKSSIQQENAALYQVIVSLIDYLKQSNTTLTTAISGGGGGGSGSGLANQPYLTHSSAIGNLPQSRQLLPGTSVTFDDSVAGERTVDVIAPDLSAITDATFITAEIEALFPNSKKLLAGAYITFDDSVPGLRTINMTLVQREWSVLTNGNVINPELIFAGGDVIMTHIP